MPTIVVLNRERSAYEISDQPVSIGRLDTNDIQIMEPSISKRHARIVPTENGWRIEDLQSSNGTFVNEKQITSSELRPGASIRCGNVELTFGPPVDGATRPSSQKNNEIYRSISICPEGEVQPQNISDWLEEDAPTFESRTGHETAGTIEHPAEQKLRLIQLIGEKTLGTFNPKQLADEILTIAIEHTRAVRGAICTFEEDGGYKPLAIRGYEEDEFPSMSRTVLNRLLEEKSAVLTRKDSSGADAALMSLNKMSVDSNVCVPLWTSDKIMGFISLDRRDSERSFTEAHLHLMIAIGHHAAIGIERGQMAELATQEQNVRSYLSQYLDSKLVHEIAKQSDNRDTATEGDPFAPAEREVTVLFSDIVSFTKISEALEPTELSKFIRDYLTAMTDIIFAHGGTIDKYIGDAVMALFGAPIANPQAAKDAISAALAMREFVALMEPPGSIQDPLRVRFGISTGKAVVGNIGSSQRVEYTALGDSVNVAARLESFARPKEICIDEDTRHRVMDEGFAIQEIGAIDVKNRNQPVKVYKVLG